MARELPKVYDPQATEAQIYQMWLDNGCFKAEVDPKKKPFCIVCPHPMLQDSFIWATPWMRLCRMF